MNSMSNHMCRTWFFINLSLVTRWLFRVNSEDSKSNSAHENSVNCDVNMTSYELRVQQHAQDTNFHIFLTIHKMINRVNYKDRKSTCEHENCNEEHCILWRIAPSPLSSATPKLWYTSVRSTNMDAFRVCSQPASQPSIHKATSPISVLL